MKTYGKNGGTRASVKLIGEITFEAQSQKTGERKKKFRRNRGYKVPGLRSTRRERGAGSGSVASQLDPSEAEDGLSFI